MATETILVEITIDGKKNTITITPYGCEIGESLDLEKLRSINSIIETTISDSSFKKMHYQSLFGSADRKMIT